MGSNLDSLLGISPSDPSSHRRNDFAHSDEGKIICHGEEATRPSSAALPAYTLPVYVPGPQVDLPQALYLQDEGYSTARCHLSPACPKTIATNPDISSLPLSFPRDPVPYSPPPLPQISLLPLRGRCLHPPEPGRVEPTPHQHDPPPLCKRQASPLLLLLLPPPANEPLGASGQRRGQDERRVSKGNEAGVYPGEEHTAGCHR